MTGAVVRRVRRGAGLLGVLCVLLGSVPAGRAESAPSPSGFSLQVSPTRLEIPAGTVTTSRYFLLTNRGNTSFEVTVEKADFVADERGAMSFLPGAPYAASEWVTVRPKGLRLKAGESRKVLVRLEVPAAPEPGDHQLAVLFKVPAGRTAANIRINRTIATPIFITVPGPVDDSVAVTDLRAPGFTLGGPVDITTRIRDFGTIHRDFRGTGRLRVRVGGDEVQFPDFTVLRGSTREVGARWNPPLICVCHATVSVPGPGGGTHASTRIVVLPLHLLAIPLAALTALSPIWFLRRRRRARVPAAAAPGGVEDGHHS
ncbi:COG1361 family protein [Sphaerisporangium aureirubrum]|uniref:DUF916 domain-containing protein n=1 Tax=Sphaerisporangium aureirubrum TaxID=1544736 RepID=A0ABW1NSH2_9ACTN